MDMDKLLAELHAMTPEQLLLRLQKGLIVDLLAKLEMGQVSHQDAAVIAKILKDNGIVVAPQKSPEEEAADEAREAADLPNFETDPDEG